MLKILGLFFITLAAAAASVTAQDKSDNSAAARAFVEALAKKDFAAAYAFFGADIKAKLPAESLPPVWAQIVSQFGEFKTIKKTSAVKLTDGENVTITCAFEKSDVDILAAFGADGKVRGFFYDKSKASDAVAAKYETPGYADPNSFAETEVTVGSGEWALPGTLTLPKNKTNLPAVVLVHGSGANDRDETHVNPSNKMFKDLAWGLATKGVAVLRYDKRSLVHGREMAAAKNFTVKEETVNDALAAAELLRRVPQIAPGKIFVLGHSLGGMLIQRIGARDAKIAGLIVMAGPARPLEDALVEQYVYIAGLDGGVSKEEQAQIDGVKQLAAKIKSLAEADRNSGEFYFGAPAAYYLDLRGYDPPQAAEKLAQPVLVLRGESDYQVTAREFADWKDALGAKKTATFKTYPRLTHIFMEDAGGQPGPKDYEKTGHVSGAVVGDIAAWILQTAK